MTELADAEPRAHVLLCDDSKIVRLTASKMLGDRCHLTLAEHGEAAWQALQTNPDIQIVFTDLGMPELDGYGLIERVRNCSDGRIRQMPVIVITGASEDEEIKQKLFDLGATDFITKPFKQADLVARTESHVKHLRQQASLEKHATVDPLTEALNAEGFAEQIAKDAAFVARHQGCWALMVIEVDDFVAVQRTIGEKVASMIIKEVANQLRKALRKEDSVGRLGLIRFAVSLPMAKQASVDALARRLCDKVKSFKLRAGGRDIQLSASVGIVVEPEGEQRAPQRCLALATESLTMAQAEGPGSVVLHREATVTTPATAAPLSIDALLDQLAREPTTTIDFEALHQRLAPLLARLDAATRTRWLGV